MRCHSSRSASVRARLPFMVLLLFHLPAYVAAAQESPQWVTINRDTYSQRYVDLDQIKPENVGQLQQLCSLDLNAVSWFSSGLLMVGGRIYVNTLTSTFAIDATSCALVWQHDISFTPWVATISNRGSAYLDGRIFRGTADGRVIALDAGTGDLVWQTQAADPSRHEAFTSAPIAWNGKVFLGIVTADLGVRGRLMAFDAVTGKEIWRFHTIPIGIEPNAETWPPPPAGYTPAGGAFWTSYSLDPATGELFGPVSNPYPDYVPRSDEEAKLYPNLYTNSVISLDAATGNLNWYCQTVSGDDHDWDLGTQPTLYRTKSGKSMLAIAGKEGYVYGLERTSNGSGQCQKKLVFRTAGTTVPPSDAPEPPNDATLRKVCPGTLGGAEWNGTAYHPGLGLLYSGMVDFCFYYSAVDHTDDPGFWTSVDKGTVRADFSKLPTGWITAMDGESGKAVWSYPTDAPVLAGLVPTRSGLLFGGDVLGNLLALDAQSGKLLKTINAGGALNHGLISYAVGGRQYVAAAVGGTSLNTAGVSGPLRVVLYGLPEPGDRGDAPAGQKKAGKGGAIGRSPSPGARARGGAGKAAVVAGVYAEHPKAQSKIVQGGMLFGAICGTCHGTSGQGSAYPPLLRHTDLANGKGGFQVLKDFLSSVPPPMPILYTGKPDDPGLLNDAEVELIGAYVQYLLSVNNPQASNSAPPGYVYHPQPSPGSRDWQAVYSVLTSPRCINCHTVTNYPRQRDSRYPHIYSVVRGADDQGALVARCNHCHGTSNDAIRKGIPGALGWKLAPVGVAWESAPGIPMTGPELCTRMQNQVLNGDIGVKELVEHLDTPLVQWAWQPGTRWNGEKRTIPPISHPDFVAAFTRWVNSGQPCPPAVPPP